MKDFYSSIQDYIDDLNFDEESTDIDCSILNQPITMAEIKNNIAKLKNNKAPGQDGIPTECWKHAPIEIFDMLHILYNEIFEHGVFPQEWAIGLISPIHKKGNKDLPSNYRGIMLLNVISKVYTNILSDRLTHWFNEYNEIVEPQSGFRKKRSTLDNIFILRTLIEKYVFHLKSRFYCAFIDYEKAFDRVHHYSLFYKLAKTGMRGKFLSSLYSMYTHVKAAVKSPHGVTEFFEINIGVQQGSVISPLLFCFYINDIEDALKQGTETVVYANMMKLFYLLYADDLVLFSSTPIGLQRLLNRLSDYCKKWRMNVNLTKTKIIVFRKAGGLKKSEKWFWNGQKIEIVSKYNYLGVMFSSSGVWFQAQKFISEQSRKALYSLESNLYKLDGLQPEIAFRVFDCKILPILLYGSAIWGTHNCLDVEKIHHRFCKFVLGVRTTTINSAVRGELGRHPIRSYIYIQILRFWFKCIHIDSPEIVKDCTKIST